MIEKEDFNKKKALDICSQFEQKKDSLTVFTFIPKTQFIQTLYDLINSNGECLYQSKNTCGITAVVHLSCVNDIVNFTRFAISLYELGIGKLNAYKVTKDQNLLKWSKKVKPSGNFNGVSLVVVGTIRFIENTSLRFRLGTMDGMTWPKEIRAVSQKCLSGVLVQKSSNLLGWNIDGLKNRLEKKEQVILLYRTSAWNKNGKFYKDSWHYIVLKKIFELPNRIIELSYWDYGKEKYTELTVFQFYTSVVKTFVFSKI